MWVRSVGVSSAYAWPPDLAAAAPGGSAGGRGCGRACAAARTRSASGGPPRRRGARRAPARSISSPSARDDRLARRPARPGAARRCSRATSSPRAERLGHVVVGAGLQRAHLLGPRRRRRTARGSASRSTRGSRGTPRRRRRPAAPGRGSPRRARCSVATSSASAAVCGGSDLEPGLAQDHLQRAQDLRLVVADEHAAAGAHGVAPRSRPPAAARLDGNSITKLVPWPGSDSAQTRPPLASTKPLAIARPRPEPPCPSPWRPR